MRRLPLFPLPVVLIPGAVMPLHIFEPRYRQMVAYCVEHDGCFGLLYHDPDRDGPFQNEPGPVGCIARILKFEPLPDGRSLILCRGEGRFRLEDGIESPASYYEGLVSPYEDEEPHPDDADLAMRRRESIALLERVLSDVLKHEGSFPELDPDGETGFQVAQVIRVDPPWQQALLEMRDELARLDHVDRLLRAVLASGE
jgi:Lon protease-like protein